MKASPALTWQEQIMSWWQQLVQQFNMQSVEIFQLIFYGGAAFIIGFLIKRYFRSLFIGLILSLIFIAFLHYAQIITLDVGKLNEFIGFGRADTLENYFKILVLWIKNNLVLAAATFLGFLIGYQSA